MKEKTTPPTEEKTFEYGLVFHVQPLDGSGGNSELMPDASPVYFKTWDDAEKFIAACDPDKKYNWQIEQVGILPLEFALTFSDTYRSFMESKPETNTSRERSTQIETKVTAW